MNKTALSVLRLGLAVTFLWVGVLIFRSPSLWISFMQPWAAALLPIPALLAIQATALLDVVVGVCLLLDIFVPLAALLGALHLVSVLVVTGITDVTVRDMGLLAATAALFLETSQTILKRGAWMEFLLPKSKR
jgi:uncharacterized membrane protein YphA (DoxX/SURF4 family)